MGILLGNTINENLSQNTLFLSIPPIFHWLILFTFITANVSFH